MNRSNESKQQKPSQSPVLKLNLALVEVLKHLKQTKTELMNRTDKYGRQLPVRVLSHAFSFLEIEDIMRCLCVCEGWLLAEILLDRLILNRYAARFEWSTYSIPEVADEGEKTKAKRRYRNRLATEENFMQGNYRQVDLKVPNVWTLCVNGSMLFAGTTNGRLHIFDLQTRSLLKTVSVFAANYEPAIYSLATHDNLVFCGSNSGQLKSFTLLPGPDLKLSKEFKGHDNIVYDIKINGELLLSDSDDKTIRIWKIETAECLRVIRPHTAYVTAVAVDWPRDLLYSRDEDGKLCVSKLSTGELVSHKEFGYIGSLHVDVPSGRLFATAELPQERERAESLILFERPDIHLSYQPQFRFGSDIFEYVDPHLTSCNNRLLVSGVGLCGPGYHYLDKRQTPLQPTTVYFRNNSKFRVLEMTPLKLYVADEHKCLFELDFTPH